MSVARAAKQLSMPKSSLDNWVRAARQGKLAEVGKGQRLPSELELELARTRKELADVKMQRRLISHLIDPVVVALATICLGLLFAFLMNLAIGRLLGAEVMGIYYIAMSVVTIAAGISRLGLDHVMLRLLPFAWKNREKAQVSAILFTALALILASSALISTILHVILGRIPFSPEVHAGLETALPYLLAAIFLTAFVITFSSAIRAFGHAAQSILYQSVLVPAVVLAGVVVLWQSNIKTFAGLISVHVLALAVSAVLVVFTMLRYKIIEWKVTKPTPSILLGPGIPLMWVSIINISMEWIDFLILGVWSDPASVGIYALCVRISLIISLILMAINTVIAPQFSLLYIKRELTQLSSLATKWTLIGTLATFPLLLVIQIFPGPVLQLFGRDFTEGVTILRILSIGQFINVATGSVGYLLMMTEHERLMRNIMVITLVLNVTANLLIAPHWGTTGVAVVSLLSISLMNITCLYFVKARLDINTLGYLFHSRHNRV